MVISVHALEIRSFARVRYISVAQLTKASEPKCTVYQSLFTGSRKENSAAQNVKKLGTSKVKEEPGNNVSTIHTVGTTSNGKMACYCCGTAGLLSASTKPLSAMDVANWGTSRECVGANKRHSPVAHWRN